MIMAWRGDMTEMRDMSVSNLLKSIMDRTKEQKTLIDIVSDQINKIQRAFLLTSDKEIIMSVLGTVLDEKAILDAAIVTAGDKTAMAFLIHRANLLTNQLIRPSPRVRRTLQLFNKFRQAWRYAVGMHMAMWEEVIQANTISIIKDVPVIRAGSTTAKQSFVQRVRDAMVSGKDVDTDNDADNKKDE